LHSRSLPNLAIDITAEKITAANKDLAAGLAKADKYFNNLDELFTADETANAIMVTTINGKNTWLNAATFATIPAPAITLQKNNFLSLLQKMVQEAKTGGKIDTIQIANRMRVLASDIDYSFFNSHTANFVTSADGCFYQLEGGTLSSLVRSNCPGNDRTSNDTLYKTAGDKQFIEASFLTNDIDITGKPVVLPVSGTPYATQAREKALYIVNKDKVAPAAHVLLSKYDIEKQTTSWQYDLSNNLTAVPTIESAYVLNNLLVIVLKTHPKLDDNFSCIAIDKTTGKAAWQFTF
jgi:outer membrane protein assembly factor BamB